MTNRFGIIHAALTEVVGTSFKRGDLLKMVVTGERQIIVRSTGILTRLLYNGAIAVKKDRTPVAKRVYGGVYIEARLHGYLRLAVLSRNLF